MISCSSILGIAGFAVAVDVSVWGSRELQGDAG